MTTPEPRPMQHTRRAIARARRRLRVSRALHTLGWAWLGAALLALAGAATAVALGWTPPWWSYLSLLGVSALAAVLYAWSRPSPDQAVAVLLDEELELKDRLGSALFAAQQPDHPFAQAVIDEAEQAARQAPVRDAVPVTVPDIWRWTLAVCAVVAVLIVFLPGAFDPFGLQEDQEKTQAQIDAELAAQEHIQEALALIEPERPEALGNPAQDPEDLMDQLEAVLSKRDLRTPQARQDAQAELSQLRDQLAELSEAQKAQDRAMQQSLSGLETSDRGPADRFVDALRRGDYDSARQELEAVAKQIDDGQLSETQKQQLQQQLKELAEQLEEKAQEQQDAAEAAQQNVQQQLQNGGMSASQAQQAAQQSTQQGTTSQQAQQQMQSAGASPQQAQQLSQQTQQARQQAQQNQSNGQASNNLSKALQQMAQAVQQGQPASPSSQSGQQQLGQMSQQQQQSQQTQQAQQQLQQAQQQLAQGSQGQQPGGQQPGSQPGGQPGGSQASNAGAGSPGGNQPGGTNSGTGGTQAGQGEGGNPIGAQRGNAGYNSVAVVDAQDGQGLVISSWQRGGEVSTGEAQVQFQTAVTQAQAAAERAVTDDRAPRRYHRAIERYFNRLPVTPEAPAE